MTTATVTINGIELEAVRSIRFDNQTATIEYIQRLDQPTLYGVPQGSIIRLTIHSDMIDQTHEGVIKGIASSKTNHHPTRATTETVTLSLYSPIRLHSLHRSYSTSWMLIKHSMQAWKLSIMVPSGNMARTLRCQTQPQASSIKAPSPRSIR